MMPMIASLRHVSWRMRPGWGTQPGWDTLFLSEMIGFVNRSLEMHALEMKEAGPIAPPLASHPPGGRTPHMARRSAIRPFTMA